MTIMHILQVPLWDAKVSRNPDPLTWYLGHAQIFRSIQG